MQVVDKDLILKHWKNTFLMKYRHHFKTSDIKIIYDNTYVHTYFGKTVFERFIITL